MIFYDDKHNERYIATVAKMKKKDCYHLSLAYLLALTDETYSHMHLLFNFEEDGIIRDGLLEEFQTGSSMAITRLAFNLWNGCSYTGKTYKDELGYEHELPDVHCTPEMIFSRTTYAPYFYEAIRIRFEMIPEDGIEVIRID